jgi:hypothetical protein
LKETYRYEDNIKIGVQQTGFYCVDWIHLAQWRDPVNTFINTAAEKMELLLHGFNSISSPINRLNKKIIV